MRFTIFSSLVLLFICLGMFQAQAASCVAKQGGCTTCDDSAAKDVYACKTCDSGYYLTEAKACATCDDAHCATCSGATIGHCTGCNTGYNLLSGTCQLPTTAETPSANKTGSVTATLRYDMTLDQFNKAGGADFFVASTATALGLNPSQIEVTDIQQGSVIVLFKIYTISSSTVTLSQLKTLLDKAVASGSMNVFPGVKVLSYSSNVVITATCPSGQYVDYDDGSCKTCPDDCPNCTSATSCKKKSKTGAIVGGVVGGVAFLAIIGVIIWKKSAIMALFSPKKVVHYDPVKSSPNSPQQHAAHHA